MTGEEKHIELINIDTVFNEQKERSLPYPIYFIAFFIIAVSLLMHGIIAARIIRTVYEKGIGFLLETGFSANAEFSDESISPHSSQNMEKQAGKEDKKNERQAGKRDGGASGNIAAEVPIVTRSLSANAENGLEIWNSTSYETDAKEIIKTVPERSSLSELYEKYGEGAPVVLIYHTHGTEAYADTAYNSFRSTDIEKNVVAVGKVLAESLREDGIGVIHIEEMFDKDDWSAAYDNSAAAVKSAIRDNPSVCYTLDIHRDCIGNEEVGYTRAVSVCDGIEAAQLMFVCGSDDAGSGHKDWRKNLSLDLTLQEKMWELCPGIMRPVDLRAASFYQDISSGAMLIEFGTCGNSLKEAKYSAKLFAQVLSEYIKK